MRRLLPSRRLLPPRRHGPPRRLVATAFLAAVFVTGCQGADAVAPSPASIPAGAVHVVADRMAFTTNTVTAPAGSPFVLAFENREGPPHNVHLRDVAGATVFQGEVFSGPALRLHDVPALGTGTYGFICDVHPDMTGQLLATEEGT